MIPNALDHVISAFKASIRNIKPHLLILNIKLLPVELIYNLNHYIT